MSSSFWSKMALSTLVLTISCATAQPFPRKAVTVIVTSSAGGVLEMMARAVSQKLAKSLGQPFIIDTRPGAHGILGADAVAKATPDGHVLRDGPGGRGRIITECRFASRTGWSVQIPARQVHLWVQR